MGQIIDLIWKSRKSKEGSMKIIWAAVESVGELTSDDGSRIPEILREQTKREEQTMNNISRDVKDHITSTRTHGRATLRCGGVDKEQRLTRITERQYIAARHAIDAPNTVE